MKIVAVLLGSALFAVSGCQSACTRPDSASEAQGLLQADRDFAALADRIGDADAFYAYMTDATIELPADKSFVQGRAAIRDRLRKLPPFRLRWTPAIARVSADGTVGWTWGDWQMYGTNLRAAPVSHGRYLDIWERQENRSWKVVVDMGNSASTQ